MATTATTTIEAGKAPRLAQHTKWRNQSRRGKSREGRENKEMNNFICSIMVKTLLSLVSLSVCVAVCECVGGVSKFLIVDAFAAGRTKIYEVRV